MSIPREGSRDTDKGILVSCAPDWCRTPQGSAVVIIPYDIYAKQADDANTAATVRQTKQRSHTSASIITVCHGDAPGSVLGVKSNTVESICRPKTWSETVRIEGHHAVRHNDLWTMNNGNTVGKLTFIEDVEVYEKPEGYNGPSDAETLLNPNNNIFKPKITFGEPTLMAQAATEVMTDTLPSTSASTPTPSLTTGVVAGGIAIPASGWGIGAGAAETGAAAAGGGILGTLATAATGVGAFLTVLLWPTSLNNGEQEMLDRLKQQPRPVPVPETDAAAGEKADVKVGTVRISRSDNPCWALACLKVGKYNGGAHGCMKEPSGDGLDSHHTPARAASPLHPDWGPAIQMDPTDHRRTASNGGMPSSGMYIAAQKAHISNGNFMGATAMDVADIKSKFGNKYDNAIIQMMAYTQCLKDNGLIK